MIQEDLEQYKNEGEQQKSPQNMAAKNAADILSKTHEFKDIQHQGEIAVELNNPALQLFVQYQKLFPSIETILQLTNNFDRATCRNISHIAIQSTGELTANEGELMRAIKSLDKGTNYEQEKILRSELAKIFVPETQSIDNIDKLIRDAHKIVSNLSTGLVLRRSGIDKLGIKALMRLGICGKENLTLDDIKYNFDERGGYEVLMKYDIKRIRKINIKNRKITSIGTDSGFKSECDLSIQNTSGFQEFVSRVYGKEFEYEKKEKLSLDDIKEYFDKKGGYEVLMKYKRKDILNVDIKGQKINSIGTDSGFKSVNSLKIQTSRGFQEFVSRVYGKEFEYEKKEKLSLDDIKEYFDKKGGYEVLMKYSLKDIQNISLNDRKVVSIRSESGFKSEYKFNIQVPIGFQEFVSRVYGKEFEYEKLTLDDIRGYFDKKGGYNVLMKYNTTKIRKIKIKDRKINSIGTESGFKSAYGAKINYPGGFQEFVSRVYEKEFEYEKKEKLSLDDIKEYFDKKGGYEVLMKYKRKDILNVDIKGHKVRLISDESGFKSEHDLNIQVSFGFQEFVSRVYGEKFIWEKITLKSIKKYFDKKGGYDKLIKYKRKEIHSINFGGRKINSIGTKCGFKSKYDLKITDLGGFQEFVSRVYGKEFKYEKKEKLSLDDIKEYFDKKGGYEVLMKYTNQEIGNINCSGRKIYSTGTESGFKSVYGLNIHGPIGFQEFVSWLYGKEFKYEKNEKYNLTINDIKDHFDKKGGYDKLIKYKRKEIHSINFGGRKINSIGTKCGFKSKYDLKITDLGGFQEFVSRVYEKEFEYEKKEKLSLDDIKEYFDKKGGYEVLMKYTNQEIGNINCSGRKIYSTGTESGFKSVYGLNIRGPSGFKEFVSRLYKKPFTYEKKERNILENSTLENILNNQELQELYNFIKIHGEFLGVDYLLAIHPQFKGTSPEIIKGAISQFLDAYQQTGSPPNNDDRMQFPIGLLPELSSANIEHITALKVGYAQQEYDKYYGKMKIIGKTSEAIRREFLIKLDEKFSVIFEMEDGSTHSIVEQIINRFNDMVTGVEGISRPKRFKAQLREGMDFPTEEQKTLSNYLSKKRSFINADDTGFGKTVSLINASEYLMEQGKVKRTLLTMPAVLRSQRKEALGSGEKGYFQPGKEPSSIIVSSIDEIDENLNSYDYVVISQTLLQDKVFVSRLMKYYDYDFLGTDEAHALKNIYSGQRAEGFTRLYEKLQLGPDNEALPLKERGYVSLLTATPIPNKVSDVALYLKVLYPERFGEVSAHELVKQIYEGRIEDIKGLILQGVQQRKLNQYDVMGQKHVEKRYYEPSHIEVNLAQSVINSDEIDAGEQIRLLRKIQINPGLLDVSPNIESSKLQEIQKILNEELQENEKIMISVTGFVEEVLRGDWTYQDNLDLPKNTEVFVLHGKVDKEKIIKSFKNHNGKCILLANETGGLGLNLPEIDVLVRATPNRTRAENYQIDARGMRKGRLRDMKVIELVAKGTIEEVIKIYVDRKYAITKKVMEGRILTSDEIQFDRMIEGGISGYDFNAEIAHIYLGAIRELNSMFGKINQQGSEAVQSLINTQGKEFIEHYKKIGRLGYQPNVNRLHGNIIQQHISNTDTDSQIILDLGSSIGLLRNHIANHLSDYVVNVDLNPESFTVEEIESGKSIVANLTHLPFEDNFAENVSSSLSFNETKLMLTEKNYERIKVLYEMLRVLKPGGEGVISVPYSLEYNDINQVEMLIEKMGGKLQKNQSGLYTSGESFRTFTLVFRKSKKSILPYEELVEKHLDLFKGCKLKKTKNKSQGGFGKSLGGNIKRIITQVKIHGKKIPITLNTEDRLIHETVESIKNKGNMLIDQYNGIHHIPEEVLEKFDWIRYRPSKKSDNYKLMKELPNNWGIITLP